MLLCLLGMVKEICSETQSTIGSNKCCHKKHDVFICMHFILAQMTCIVLQFLVLPHCDKYFLSQMRMVISLQSCYTYSTTNQSCMFDLKGARQAFDSACAHSAFDSACVLLLT